jgi:hypothetical protein
VNFTFGLGLGSGVEELVQPGRDRPELVLDTGAVGALLVPREEARHKAAGHQRRDVGVELLQLAVPARRQRGAARRDDAGRQAPEHRRRELRVGAQRRRNLLGQRGLGQAEVGDRALRQVHPALERLRVGGLPAVEGHVLQVRCSRGSALQTGGPGSGRRDRAEVASGRRNATNGARRRHREARQEQLPPSPHDRRHLLRAPQSPTAPTAACTHDCGAAMVQEAPCRIWPVSSKSKFGF